MRRGRPPVRAGARDAGVGLHQERHDGAGPGRAASGRRRPTPSTASSWPSSGQAYGLAGQTGKAREVLQRLTRAGSHKFVSPYHLAYVHTGLGEHELALDMLERALRGITPAACTASRVPSCSRRCTRIPDSRRCSEDEPGLTARGVCWRGGTVHTDFSSFPNLLGSHWHLFRPACPAALQDRYRIERELGQGGMATVYLAEDLKHDRKVALKVLQARARRRARRRAVRAGDQDHRGAAASAHPAAVRLGHGGRLPLLRHAVHRRRDAARPSSTARRSSASTRR